MEKVSMFKVAEEFEAYGSQVSYTNKKEECSWLFWCGWARTSGAFPELGSQDIKGEQAGPGSRHCCLQESEDGPSLNTIPVCAVLCGVTGSVGSSFIRE